MQTTDAPHIPVLLEEVIEVFKQVQPGYFVDCTLGYAGHSSAIYEQFGDRVKLIGIDRDDEAIAFSQNRLGEHIKIYKGSFSQVFPTLQEHPITGVLADFGVSSLQLDKLERGFSFHSQSLDMRMDTQQELTAYDVINRYSKLDLERIFKEYGEIRPYKKLADAIVSQRPFQTAQELASLAKSVMPKTKHNPATLLFQAVRIEVNSELLEIEKLLDALQKMQPKGAIIALITFHSLEDRIVKQRFKKWSQNCICAQDAFRCACGNDNALGKVITKKPIIATKQECAKNPRSRSAKLRVFQFGGC